MSASPLKKTGSSSSQTLGSPTGEAARPVGTSLSSMGGNSPSTGSSKKLLTKSTMGSMKVTPMSQTVSSLGGSMKRGPGRPLAQHEVDLTSFSNAHQLADFLLEPKLRRDPKLRKELDAQLLRKIGRSAANHTGETPKVKKRTEHLVAVLEINSWERTEEQIIEIHAELSKLHAFDKLQIPPDAEMNLCRVVAVETFPSTGMVVYHEGKPADKFYIILQGSLRLESSEKKYIIYEGDTLGEACLLHDEPRAETAWVEEPAQLLVLKKRDYDGRIKPLHLENELARVKEFGVLAAFNGWTEERLMRVSQVTRDKRYAIGEHICTEGDDTLLGHYLMMIKKGTVEAWKHNPDTGEEVLLGVLEPGDTISLRSVVKGEPIAFTARCSSIVDVMLTHSHEVLPQKDSVGVPCIDKETMAKLLDRERPVPTGEGLNDFAANQLRWTQYKAQCVSETLFYERWRKHAPKVPVSFNKWTNLPLRSHADSKGNQVGESLTRHLSTAPLPTFARARYDTEEGRERNILGGVVVGDKLMPKKEFEETLRAALAPPLASFTKTGSSAPVLGAGGDRGQFMDTMWLPNSTGRLENDRIPTVYDPMYTLAGIIIPDPLKTSHISYPFLATHASAERHYQHAPVSKNLGPVELDAVPPSWKYQPSSESESEDQRDTPKRRRRPAFVPVKASNTGPFRRSSRPAPSWDMADPCRWVLRRAIRPPSAPPSQIPDGVAPWRPVCHPDLDGDVLSKSLPASVLVNAADAYSRRRPPPRF